MLPFPACLAASALVAVFVAGPAAAQFTNVTPPALADPGRAWGAVFADFNGDGEPDIYFQNTALTPSRLLLHDSGDAFVDAAPLPVLYALDPNAADYDNDGDLDLFIRSAGLPDRLMRNDGSGTFDDATFPPLDDSGQARCAGWADYDLDGDLDVYLAVITPGGNKLLRNDGPREFADVTAAPLNPPAASDGVAWSDYDLDGDPDLYLQTPSGALNKLLRNDGAAGFTDVTAGLLDGAGAAGHGAAWADYDNDGDLDLYLANDYFDASRLLRNDGGSFADASGGVVNRTTGAYGCGWADYDNDGWLDLHVATFGFADSAPNKLFHNEGDGTFTDVVIAGVTDSSRTLAAAWADHDGDGDLDLFCADYETPNRLFRNDLANGNHWLHVDLVGTTSNRSGVGARILLAAGGMQQLREVGGDLGYMSQGSLTAEFGLGGATTVDALAVLWPTGELQPVAVPAVDQRITVVETPPAVDAPLVSGNGGELKLLGAAPNPFRAATSIRYALPAASPVRMTVHDVAGRRVAVLVDALREGGANEVTWDGRSARGDRVTDGVYFVRVEAAGGVRTSRIVAIR